jgi:hypothetical protein
VAIENPPPIETLVARVTTYAGLADIGSGNYFAPGVTRRVVVLETDGESRPFNPSAITAALAPAFGYRFLAIRFWAADEGVYGANGRREPGYHPSPAGKLVLAQLAASLGGRSYDEADLAQADDYLHQIIGTGRTVPTRRAASVRTLAPFVAGLAVLLLIVGLAPTPADLRSRRVRRRVLRAGDRLVESESVTSS